MKKYILIFTYRCFICVKQTLFDFQPQILSQSLYKFGLSLAKATLWWVSHWRLLLLSISHSTHWLLTITTHWLLSISSHWLLWHTLHSSHWLLWHALHTSHSSHWLLSISTWLWHSHSSHRWLHTAHHWLSLHSSHRLHSSAVWLLWHS